MLNFSFDSLSYISYIYLVTGIMIKKISNVNNFKYGKMLTAREMLIYNIYLFMHVNVFREP